MTTPRIHTLPNGVRVICDPMPGLRTLALTVAVASLPRALTVIVGVVSKVKKLRGSALSVIIQLAGVAGSRSPKVKPVRVRVPSSTTV